MNGPCPTCGAGLWFGVCPKCDPALTAHGKAYEAAVFPTPPLNVAQERLFGSRPLLNPQETPSLYVQTMGRARRPVGKPSDWYDPKAQRDARPKKYPAPTPLGLLKLWERRLASCDSLTMVRVTLRELRTEIERRET